MTVASRRGSWSYDRIAHLYDVDMARSMPFDDTAFYAAQVAGVAGPVLEVGCGNGRILLELRSRGIDLVGIDRSHPMLAALQERARKRGRPASVVRMDVRKLAFADATFGAVLCPYSLITYMNDEGDAARLVREAVRVLRRGGLLVLDAFVPRASVYSDEFRLDYRRPFETGTLARYKRVSQLQPGYNRIERRYDVERDGRVVESIDTVDEIRVFSPGSLRALAASAKLRAVHEAWDYGTRAAESAAQFFTLVVAL